MIKLNSLPRDEAFTPIKYIKSVREVFKYVIDIDPCSTEFGNSRIKARIFYSKEQNGLDKTWYGNVYLNCPFSRGNLPIWTRELITRYKNSFITQAIQLVPNDTSTNWFQQMMKFSKLACLVNERLSFINSENKYIGESNRFGSVFFYLGNNKQEFVKEFEKHGVIVNNFNF